MASCIAFDTSCIVARRPTAYFILLLSTMYHVNNSFFSTQKASVIETSFKRSEFYELESTGSYHLLLSCFDCNFDLSRKYCVSRDREREREREREKKHRLHPVQKNKLNYQRYRSIEK